MTEYVVIEFNPKKFGNHGFASVCRNINDVKNRDFFVVDIDNEEITGVFTTGKPKSEDVSLRSCGITCSTLVTDLLEKNERPFTFDLRKKIRKYIKTE